MTSIQLYNNLKEKVTLCYTQLNLNKLENKKGRKLALCIIDILSLGIFKQLNGIPTKKALYNIFCPKCSYKTLVVNLNRFYNKALLIILALLKLNQKKASLVKHSDSTRIPVCLNKNGRRHRTMQGLASWAKTHKGWYYGLKLHITSDLNKNILSIRFSSANKHDSHLFCNLNKDLNGIFVCDSGYLSKEVKQRFDKEGERLLIVMPRKNQKKIITSFQYHLLKTRMLIEINFRNLKLFHALVTSLPRSINGYFSNYTYSILSYLLN